MTRTPWTTITIAAAAFSTAVLALLFAAIPRTEDGMGWTDPMIDGGWMAWTFPTALFFWGIGSLLITLTILAIRFPETPRRGILHIETTRGDRLFISLLGSGFISLIWLFVFGPPLWGALICCLIWAAAVFRWV